MRLAVIIKAKQGEELPTAEELRRAGFAVSSALAPCGGAAEAVGPDTGQDRVKGAPRRAGPICRRRPDRQRP